MCLLSAVAVHVSFEVAFAASGVFAQGTLEWLDACRGEKPFYAVGLSSFIRRRSCFRSPKLVENLGVALTRYGGGKHQIREGYFGTSSPCKNQISKTVLWNSILAYV